MVKWKKPPAFLCDFYQQSQHSQVSGKSYHWARALPIQSSMVCVVNTRILRWGSISNIDSIHSVFFRDLYHQHCQVSNMSPTPNANSTQATLFRWLTAGGGEVHVPSAIEPCPLTHTGIFYVYVSAVCLQFEIRILFCFVSSFILSRLTFYTRTVRFDF